MSSFSFGFRIKVHFKVSQFKVEQNSYFLNRLLSRELRSFKSVFCVHSLKLQGDTALQSWHKPVGLNQDCNTHVMPGNKSTLKVFSYSSQRNNLTVQFSLRYSQLTLTESMEILHSKGHISALYINMGISTKFLRTKLTKSTLVCCKQHLKHKN